VAKTYRIFPGIGIARVGNSPDGFFLAPEVPGLGPLELTPDDLVRPVHEFKDPNRKLRRQAARFRVFEFDSITGSAREIVAGAGVQIEWRVELANEKAAAGRFESETVPESAIPRNPNVPQADLIIKPTFAAISGTSQNRQGNPSGKFKGQAVYLGELRTDGKGRLIVLGGYGDSASIPPNKPVGTGGNNNNFANSEFWHDDVSDGPVTATVKIVGQPDEQADSAWVIVAPPDFSPYTNGIATMYDVAAQAGGTAAPAAPSFQDDVFPILNAATRLRWVSKLKKFSNLSQDWNTLSQKGNVASDDLRQATFLGIMSLETGHSLANFRFTANQRTVLSNWAKGNFVIGYNPAAPVSQVTPNGLDLASLSVSVGGGFFPGIEAGIRMTVPGMYRSPFRITNMPFTFAGVTVIPHPGFITRNMACPWQADFFECENQSVTSVWWPAQRPIEIFVDPSLQSNPRWDDSIPDHQALVDNYWKLGIILPSDFTNPGLAQPLLEVDRDPSVPHV